MRHRGRLVVFGAICAGALWLAAAPASALALTVGGSTVGASLSVGDGPAQIGVQAPDAATINVQADPSSGVQASVKTAQTPPLDVAVATPDVSSVAPITPPDPAPVPPASAGPSPTAPTPAPSPAPVAPHPGVSAQPAKVAPAPAAVRTGRDVGVTTVTRPINSILHNSGGAHPTSVTASIASGSDAGILSALESNATRLLLWIALAAFVVAMRLFVGSATSRGARAS
jgi:hypothetical protein